ncbi:MAG: LLM class flavin-dependent oxidoreductase [Gammaproteobacteria bacterium]|nr:LLM class flavin-dependent oxidoreductase [Gammaproteobacteria bacterium]
MVGVSLKISVSGPQVVEGWYGQPYPKPLARTREWISIFRDIVSREGPVSFDGKHYQLPLDGGTGLGKPLKLILHPVREEIPLYLGAEGPKNVALGAELCDGWIPMFLSPYRMDRLYGESLKHKRADFDICAPVTVIVTDDIQSGIDSVKQNVGFYVGGMGAKSFNVHKDHISRMGFEDEANHVQELFMSGRRDEAMAAVPNELCDEISLIGPKERIRERLGAWRESPVTTINVSTGNRDTLAFMAEELL